MDSVVLDEAFPHTYNIDAEAELPPGGEGYSRFYYPGASDQGGHADLMLLVLPADREPWYGLFSGAPGRGRLAHGVYSSPDSGMLCVVVNGQGYMVQSEKPTDWSEIPVSPVIEVRPLPEERLLLMSDFTLVVAYGPHGHAWRWKPAQITDDLVMDRVSDGHLHVRGYNYATGDVQAAVDLSTGTEINSE